MSLRLAETGEFNDDCVVQMCNLSAVIKGYYERISLKERPSKRC